MEGFLKLGHCLRTIGHCFPYCFLEIFVGGKALMEGDKAVMWGPHQRKSCGGCLCKGSSYPGNVLRDIRSNCLLYSIFRKYIPS